MPLRHTSPGPYRATICRERELTLDEKHTFSTTEGDRGSPRMRVQLNGGATSETTRTWKTMHTIHTSIHSIKGNMKGRLWRPMIFGDLLSLKLPDICLTGEENPEKIPPRKLVPTAERTQARCVTGAHAIACSTAVDDFYNCVAGF